MKTAIAIIAIFGVIVALVAYGTREALNNNQPKVSSRIHSRAPEPRVIEKVQIIERVKLVEVPVTKIIEREPVEKIVYVPEKTIVKEIHHEPAPVPVPQAVEPPTPRPVFVPAPQAVIMPAVNRPPRPTYSIQPPPRAFHPQIAPRAFYRNTNRGYNHYRAYRPNYRRY